MKQISRLLLGFFLICLMAAPGLGHGLRIPVVVDTDMGLDDTRALVLIMNDPHLEIKAIVTADGSANPQAAVCNLQRVIQFLDKPAVPLGQGEASMAAPPPWRSRSDSLGEAPLPASQSASPVPPSREVIEQALKDSQEKLTYICLGPLTNLAAVLARDPALRSRLKALLYAGTPPEVPSPSWNTVRDLEAARTVFASGVPVFVFDLKCHPNRLDSSFLREIKGINTPAARLITLLYHSPRTKKLLGTEHSQLWDDTIPLYLSDPTLGKFEPLSGSPAIQVLVSWNAVKARAAYLELLRDGSGQALASRKSVVLLNYPTQPQEFRPDVQPFVRPIIARHGLEEFKAALLTNELHRHLGTYSILGAKMGIRAREILGADHDSLTVVSHAGLKPPLSCFNDGLQASTGATLSMGTIRVMEGEEPIPAATFQYGSKKLTLRLKDDIFRSIQAEQKAALNRYGTLGPEYFRDIRAASLKHWLELDRRKIFEESLEQEN